MISPGRSPKEPKNRISQKLKDPVEEVSEDFGDGKEYGNEKKFNE